MKNLDRALTLAFVSFCFAGSQTAAGPKVTCETCPIKSIDFRSSVALGPVNKTTGCKAQKGTASCDHLMSVKA
jgi:hypothetical protein